MRLYTIDVQHNLINDSVIIIIIQTGEKGKVNNSKKAIHIEAECLTASQLSRKLEQYLGHIAHIRQV